MGTVVGDCVGRGVGDRVGTDHHAAFDSHRHYRTQPVPCG
jgi:hypothetical protein